MPQQLIPLCLFQIKIFQFFDIQRQSENIKQNNIEMTFTTKGSEVMKHIEMSFILRWHIVVYTTLCTQVQIYKYNG